MKIEICVKNRNSGLKNEILAKNSSSSIKTNTWLIFNRNTKIQIENRKKSKFWLKVDKNFKSNFLCINETFQVDNF